MRALSAPLVVVAAFSPVPAGAHAAGTTLPAPPMVLPAAGSRAVTSPAWILGVRGQARPLVVPAARARGLARRLGSRLWYAEPDRARVRSGTRSAYDSDPGGWARGAVVPADLAPPSPAGVPIAVIDDFVDSSLPDLAGHVTYLNGTTSPAIEGPHGTMVASAATAAANGQGVEGVLPGGQVLSFGVSTDFTCGDSVDGIYAAIKAHARVINMSYGSTALCYAEYVALQYALGQGILAVASAGNEFANGNPITYPAALPHVLSVAALDPDLSSSYFSTANAAVDVSAPGRDVPLDIPLAFDTQDGAQDGVTTASGTSFSAPMAAGAAAWLLAARPGIDGPQAGELLRRSAIDVGRKGYDTDTGFGLINVPRALAAPTPHRDALEPNDGMVWVNGTAFRRPDPFIWSGRGSGLLSASVDQVEDPADVYRFKLPGRSRVTITLRPRSGDPDLEVFDRHATSTSQRSYLIAASRHNGTAVDRVRLRNSGRRAVWGFVAVSIDPSVRNLDARYTLSFHRF